MDAITGATASPPSSPVPESAAGIQQIGEETLRGFEVAAAEATPEPLPTPPPAPAATPVASAEATRLADASQQDLDAELLAIFLEEAREVLATINQHLPLVHATPNDQDSLVTLRRSFHTLKGSGRMVGLMELGEAAWAVEQVLNGWLHEVRAATAALLEMLDLAAETFKVWVVQLEAGGGSHVDAAELIRRCRLLGGAEDAEAAIPVPPAPAVEEAVPEQAAPAEAAPEVPEEAPEGTVSGAVASAAAVPDEVAPEQAEPLPSAEVVSFPAPPPVRIGDLEVAPTLYNLYLDEARGLVATLQARLGLEEVPGNDVIRAAHTAASISAATGFVPISRLARALENTLVRLSQLEASPSEAQRFVFARCAGALEGMLGAIAERRMPGEEADLAAELDAMMPPAEPKVEAEAEEIGRAHV